MNDIEEIANAIRREVATSALPEGDTSDLFLMYAVLLLARGQDVSRKDVHNAWVAWMVTRGEEQASMVPFDQLPSCNAGRGLPFRCRDSHCRCAYSLRVTPAGLRARRWPPGVLGTAALAQAQRR